MTPEQADEGFVELNLPDGGQVLVAIGGDPGSELESSVVETMLAVTGDKAAVLAALTDYAERSGVSATVLHQPGSVIVDLR